MSITDNTYVELGKYKLSFEQILNMHRLLCVEGGPFDNELDLRLIAMESYVVSCNMAPKSRVAKLMTKPRWEWRRNALGKGVIHEPAL